MPVSTPNAVRITQSRTPQEKAAPLRQWGQTDCSRLHPSASEVAASVGNASQQISRAEFAEAAGVGQGERHEVLGFELAETAAEAFGFAEFLAGVSAAVLGHE